VRNYFTGLREGTENNGYGKSEDRLAGDRSQLKFCVAKITTKWKEDME
jgi:hypothetical protein